MNSATKTEIKSLKFRVLMNRKRLDSRSYKEYDDAKKRSIELSKIFKFTNFDILAIDE